MFASPFCAGNCLTHNQTTWMFRFLFPAFLAIYAYASFLSTARSSRFCPLITQK